jgi:6-phosphogluconolactonase
VGSTLGICADSEELAERSAEHIAAAAERSVNERGRFTLCLSGGDTPMATYALLGGRLSGSMPWDHVHVFWGDERCIPLDRPDNHFTMANQLMLSRVPIPASSVHRMHGEAADAERAAADYEAVLRDFFDPSSGEPPAFDLVLLGMGEDGHVASLFPGSPGLAERTRWVADHYVVKRGQRVQRLTLTMPVIAAAHDILVLVAGELKSEALAEVLEDETDLPARQLVSEARQVHWLVDRAAAGKLRTTTVPESVAR